MRRVATAAGIIGPAAFTIAFTSSERRQDGYSIRDEHISGLAAPDARNPEVLLTGFLVMGGSTILFATALRDRLGGPRGGLGPILLALSGAGAIGAGLLRPRPHAAAPPRPTR